MGTPIDTCIGTEEFIAPWAQVIAVLIEQTPLTTEEVNTFFSSNGTIAQMNVDNNYSSQVLVEEIVATFPMSQWWAIIQTILIGGLGVRCTENKIIFGNINVIETATDE
jgi:hypothetical protein